MSQAPEQHLQNGKQQQQEEAVFRRGASGFTYPAQPPQQRQQQQPHQPNVVRSPSGRATRPDILDALQVR